MFDKIIALYAGKEYNANRTGVCFVWISVEVCCSRIRTSVSSETLPH